MPYSEAAKRATAKYKKENIKRIALEMKLEQFELIKAYAGDRPINTVLKEIIFEHINKGT